MDKQSFLKGLQTGLSLGRETYDYIRIVSPTVPVTDGYFLEEQDLGAIAGLTACDVAVRRLGEEAPDRVYLAYVANGTAHVKYTDEQPIVADSVWVNALFSEPAIDVALAFDGTVRDTLTESIIVTDSAPYVFWVTPDGELKCRVVGTLGGMTLAASGCTKVTAVRTAGGGYSSVDFGLCVFFLLGGALYYRQLIDREWSDAVPITFGPQETWVDIAAYRTLDYRIVLQCLSDNDKVYELFTQYQGFAKRGSEHIRIAGATYQSQLIEIYYHEGKLAEHMEIVNATLDAPYGGLYAIGTPVIVNAYNVEDANEDWGKIAVFVFDKHLDPTEVAAQYAAFTILDSRGRTYTAQSATLGADGKTVTLTFLDFNNASGICQARYIAGTVTTMAGETLVDTSYSFTPQNLVPTQIPVPEPLFAENVGIEDMGYCRVRFYETDGLTLLATEWVRAGDDCEYGTNEVWATSANTGTAVANITEDVRTDLDLYVARWTVKYYSRDGQTLQHTEYVLDGADATWGAGQDWSNTAEGSAVAGILEDISANISVYSMVSFWARIDSYVKDANTTMLTHTGSRQPAVKTNTGEAAGVFCYNSGGSAYGGNWFSFYLIGKTAADCAFTCGGGVATGTFTHNSNTYYYCFCAMSPSWGGAAVYNNPVGFPEMHDVQTFIVNGSTLTQSGAEAIAAFLQLE